MAPLLVRKLRFSERLIIVGTLIVVGIRWIDIFESVLLPIQIDELQLIVCADPVAQVIEELDDGLGLLRCPVVWDCEGDCEWQARR